MRIFSKDESAICCKPMIALETSFDSVIYHLPLSWFCRPDIHTLAAGRAEEASHCAGHKKIGFPGEHGFGEMAVQLEVRTKAWLRQDLAALSQPGTLPRAFVTKSVIPPALHLTYKDAGTVRFFKARRNSSIEEKRSP